MPLRLFRSGSNRILWEACADRFLAAVGDHPGPDGHSAQLWLTHRHLRDRLLERAHDQGIRGWLAPPICFFSDLPQRFGITGKPLGLLARRRLVADLAEREAARLGIHATGGHGILRGHIIDSLLSELLPEGTAPDELEQSLEAVADDDFARRRNQWILEVYRSYLDALGPDRFDPRSLHSLLATAIDAGALPKVLAGAGRLHVYGIYTLRSRRALIESLARQTEVEVDLYVPAESESGEWDDLAGSLHLDVEELDGSASGRVRVQPAPDSLREYRWIAGEIKRRILEDGIEPHDVAVLSRTGREDTQRASEALRSAGVPVSARQRIPLCDIGALKAVLELLRGAAAGWTYRPLRNILVSPYFDTSGPEDDEGAERRQIDLRGLDFVAGQRRVSGIGNWAEALEGVAEAKESGMDRDVRRLTVSPDRLRADARHLRVLGGMLARLDGDRGEHEWVQLTLEIVREGILDLRKRASWVVGDRWDIVRFDQRGLRQLETLLAEWSDLFTSGGGTDLLTVAEWHRLLERLLETHELALSTPDQQGVQVMEAHDAALTPFRVVFATHANDREFPQAFSPRGLFLQEELSRLRQTGLPVTDRQLSLRRERTLWRAVVQGEAVTVSYRTTDAEGTPLLPSLMVPAHEESTELPRTFEPMGSQPVSAEDESRAAAVALRSLGEQGGIVEVPNAARLFHAVVAASGEAMRGVRNASGESVLRPNPWHGEIRDPAVLDELARRYGDEHVWSASQLEMYAACPFIYLTERVLGIDSAEEAEEDTSPLAFGGVAHDILQQFYEELIERGLPGSFGPAEEALYGRIAEETLRQREEKGEWLGSPILWKFTREEVKRAVGKYLRWEVGYSADKGERPVWCELELRTDQGEPVELVHADLDGVMRQMRLTGRIDRVDNAGIGGAPRYRILDYKSSNIPKASGYRDGALLQAPLYMFALEQVKGIAAEKGRYRAIKKPGDPKDGAAVGGGKVGVENYDRALRYAFSIPARVRAGLFEPVMAASGAWKSYHPGIEVTRTRAQLPKAPKQADPVEWSRFRD